MSDPAASFRRSIYVILAAVSCTMVLARITTLESRSVGPDKQRTPFLSANDRSRWCTVRALVDEGTYAIDAMIEGRDKNWKTIDLVRHRGPDGKQHYFSSKPPLLPTLIAGEYWILQKLTGASIARSPKYVGRILLFTTNVVPLMLYFVLLSRWIERTEVSDFSRVFVFAAACFGTFLTTFAVTINNHLPAAICVLIAAYIAQRIWYDGARNRFYFVIAGSAAGFAAANELPALSLVVLLGVAILRKAPWQTLTGYVPGVLVVAAAFFATNWYAHGDWRPPYAHRSDGRLLFEVDNDQPTSLSPETIPPGMLAGLQEFGVEDPSQVRVRERWNEAGWELFDEKSQQRFAANPTDSGWHVHAWDHWYDYEGSYWTSDKRRGVDRGEQSRKTYALHVLLGHHGLFSLTPIWMISVIGLICMLGPGTTHRPAFALFILTLTLVCLVFYLGLRPMVDRNYGGVCCGFRWLFWFTPLWLIAMLPGVECLSRHRWLRGIAICLLAISVFSVSFPWTNPWSQPWLFQYWESLGWISYP